MGNAKDLHEWAQGSPFSQWKWVFTAGLNGLRPGIGEIMKWAEDCAKPGQPPLTEIAFDDAAKAAGFRDNYRETSSFLYYVLTQKLAKNVLAIEILREIKRQVWI